MRTGWSAEDAVVAVDYSTPQLRLDVWAGKRRLFGGAVTAETQVDGKPLKANGSWEEVCWFKDKDVDYLELAMPLQGGTRLERQILLARRDGFLLIADHVQGAKAAGAGARTAIAAGPGAAVLRRGRDARRPAGRRRAAGAAHAAGPAGVADRSARRRVVVHRRQRAIGRAGDGEDAGVRRCSSICDLSVLPSSRRGGNSPWPKDCRFNLPTWR